MKYIAKWYQPNKISRPDDEKVILTTQMLRKIVVKQLGEKMSNHFNFYLGDDLYYLTPLDDAREIIKNSKADRLSYSDDKFDCDDFALILKAHFAQAARKNGERRHPHCFGMIWGEELPTHHAMNWMINEDQKLRLVEPQTGEIYFPKKEYDKIYFMIL